VTTELVVAVFWLALERLEKILFQIFKICREIQA